MKYQVWLRLRDVHSLHTVAQVRIHEGPDRLAAEKVAETGKTSLHMLIIQLQHLHPESLVSTEVTQVLA